MTKEKSEGCNSCSELEALDKLELLKPSKWPACPFIACILVGLVEVLLVYKIAIWIKLEYCFLLVTSVAVGATLLPALMVELIRAWRDCVSKEFDLRLKAIEHIENERMRMHENAKCERAQFQITKQSVFADICSPQFNGKKEGK